jgi:hypothetical protein
MKNTLLILSAVFILASCGKYEKPFITFKSPEKRLMDKTWKLDKIIDENGNESTPNQTFNFKIEGNDSIVTRTVENVTYTGTWNWLTALEGKLDKQRIIINLVTPLNPTNPSIMYDVKVLTSKKMEIVDRASAINAGDRFFFSAE